MASGGVCDALCVEYSERGGGRVVPRQAVRDSDAVRLLQVRTHQACSMPPQTHRLFQYCSSLSPFSTSMASVRGFPVKYVILFHLFLSDCPRPAARGADRSAASRRRTDRRRSAGAWGAPPPQRPPLSCSKTPSWQVMLRTRDFVPLCILNFCGV